MRVSANVPNVEVLGAGLTYFTINIRRLSTKLAFVNIKGILISAYVNGHD